MSVFNNIPAFNGLGKASLKLDFETETQLKDFARRYIVEEGNEPPDNDPDPEKAAKAIINNLYRRTTGDAYMKPHKGGVDGPGDMYIITDTRSKAKKDLDEIKALQKYEVQKFNKEALKDIEEGDPLLYEQLKSDLNTAKAQESAPITSPLLKEVYRIKSKYPDAILLFKVGDYYETFGKDAEIVSNTLNLVLISRYGEKVSGFPAKYLEHNISMLARNGYKVAVDKSFDDGTLFVPWKTAPELPAPETKQNKFEQSKNDIKPSNIKKEPDEVKIINEILAIQYPEYRANDKKLIEPLLNTYLLEDIWEQQRVVNRFDGSYVPAGYQMRKDAELIADAILANGLYNNNYIPINKIQDAYKDYWYDVKKLKEKIDELKDLKNVASLSELKKRLKKLTNYLNKIKDLQAKFLHGDYFKKVGLNGLGAASDTLYNNLSILDTRGMSPTYQILPSYDQFFKPAEHKNSFAGFGLDDTKTLIADICRKHYKECAAIAAHLKGKTLLQSCFNLWHWLHHNIRYEYDREGREEVRTPLRVWADRKRGVDCDCLSVFAWCVLKCMGYNPVFELVAFRNKKQLSHIFINCDGVVVDRVWFVFNQRPPQVTKREIYEVKLLQNLGQLF